MSDPSSAEFFDQVRDGLRSALAGDIESFGGYSHGYGVKVTIGAGERAKEHYEAQFVRGDLPGSIVLEVGFHSEYPKAERNDEVLAALLAHERSWRKRLGADPVAGAFLGNDRWRRISETWTEFDLRDPELVFEVAQRLNEYIETFEPLLAR